MLVSDLHHFLDMPEDVPGPARRLAEHLSNIVRAASVGDAGTAWASALPCRRRPGNRRCPGRMVVSRTELAAPVRWQCTVCGDEGVTSNWADSPFDLRRRSPALVGDVNEIVIPDQVAAVLRELRLLDTECLRLVFRIRAHRHGAVLAAEADELVELIGSVAAEANHEPDRPRGKRLYAAYERLDAAARTTAGR